MYLFFREKQFITKEQKKKQHTGSTLITKAASDPLLDAGCCTPSTSPPLHQKVVLPVSPVLPALSLPAAVVGVEVGGGGVGGGSLNVRRSAKRAFSVS